MTAWTPGQWVQALNGDERHWDGSGWADGKVPTPPVATGATAGTPGTFTPAGCITPADGAAIAVLTASPTTSWSTGQYVAAANADERYWSGNSWQSGRRPAPPATGATAGNPGTFTPAGCVTPADLAGMSGLTANPTTAWTTGQHVISADTDYIHWNGTDWLSGAAP